MTRPTNAELKALLAAATPGPWCYVVQLTSNSRNRAAVYVGDRFRHGITAPASVKGSERVCDCGKTPLDLAGGPTWANNRNAALIVAAVNSLEELVRENEAMSSLLNHVLGQDASRMIHEYRLDQARAIVEKSNGKA